MPESSLDRALRLLTYGVYVVSTARDGRQEAFLTPWLTQVSLGPPTVALSVQAGEPAGELLLGGAPFAISVLRAGQKELAEAFRRAAEGDGALRGEPTAIAGNGCPYLADALAVIECDPAGTLDTGKGYTLALGAITSATILSEGQPLTLRQTGMDPLEG